MKRNLENLSGRLNHLGNLNEAESVNKLIEIISGLDNADILKSGSADSYNQSGLEAFLSAVEGDDDGDSNLESEEFNSWSKIIEDFNKVPNQVEKFHEIANNVALTVIGPLKSSYDRIRGSGAPEPTEAGRNLVKFKINQMNVKPYTADSSDSSSNGFLLTTSLLPAPGIKRIASSDKYLATDLDGDSPSARLSRSHGDAIGSAASKPGFFGRAFSIIGILFSGPLLVKNVYEAWQNGNAILNELPLDRYGIPKGAALTGLGAGKMLRKIQEARDNNEDDPEALYEILEISKTISAFWLDIVFSVTNALMFIIDILTLIVAIVDGPLPIADIAAGFIGMLLSFGLMGVELYTESVVHKFWDKENLKIREIAEKNLERLKSASVESPTAQADQTMRPEQSGLNSFISSVNAEVATA